MGAQLDELIRAVLQHPAMSDDREGCATVRVKITGIEIEFSLKCASPAQDAQNGQK